ncbi:DUF4127 family protein [Meiothermus granaticius]|uniref:DUF4127 family protein n=1 Tax=Meiothermus granaticius NBRC 107808 TaxID=1227551 RepID=A0A399F969_9DEIN|nr:DUF4127 family protein [Meiothermus granaticius]RIH93194.1 hypothetical protein Mgrana_00821 [Meiothermus granaticius NBRC 107808]GEM86601.1 hypothetical protein MGR01S_12260 [Meiothermus granaticius NBRC 107808]
MRALLLPCDTRPPTLELPHQLARVAGVELRSPPLGMLNRLNEPGDTKAMAEWLWQEAPEADLALVNLETLTLGGMIPARRVSEGLEEALGRLEALRRIRQAHPKLRILAYGVIVRVAHGDDPVEEKPYYGQWGAALRRVSEWTDRVERGGDLGELERARAAVPAEILEDWLTTRERNHALHQAAIGLLQEGVLEHLCLTLDDTAPYGLAARDRRRLEARLDELGLWERADMYPGADEGAVTLLARALVNTWGRTPRVWVRYPSALAEAAPMRYEDRPLGELVKAHLRAAGCARAETPEEADFVLAVNAPAVAQGEARPDLEQVDTAARHLPEFLDRLREDQGADRRIAVADVAYANGAEERFTRLLLRALNPVRLVGYAAWNTAGNTLGSAIASGVCALESPSPLALAEANLSRLVDDWLYQGRVRAEVARVLTQESGAPPNPYDLGPLREIAEQHLEARLAPLVETLWREQFAPHLPGVRLERRPAHLAWPRLFTGVFPLKLIPEGDEP